MLQDVMRNYGIAAIIYSATFDLLLLVSNPKLFWDFQQGHIGHTLNPKFFWDFQ